MGIIRTRQRGVTPAWFDPLGVTSGEADEHGPEPEDHERKEDDSRQTSHDESERRPDIGGGYADNALS